MKIIGIDSSGLVASVAILEDDKLVAEYTIDYKITHSQTLLPMLDEICRMTEQDLTAIDAIAVAAGPGSFTGLRIGSATAKGLGLALSKPIIAVPTVDAISMNLWGTTSLVCPMMDARRQQVYTGLYSFEDGSLNVIKEQCAVSLEEICEEINKLGRDVILLGDGIPVYKELLTGLLKVNYSFAPPHMARQRAGALCTLAAQYMRDGKIQPADEHSPIYLRLSQAERERAEHGAQ